VHIRSAAADLLLSKKGILVCILAVSAAAQSLKAPTFNPEIPSSTIIREDLFAGFLGGDRDGNERLLRGEKNLEILLAERPQDRPGLTAWKGGIAFKRAIDAVQAKRTDEFEREYRKALAFYAEAARLAPRDLGVMAVTGGGFAINADRLPERYRADGWNTAYGMYSGVWQVQRSDVDKLPMHLKGELLAGMAQSAQRSGHLAESAQFLNRILTTMPGTPYAAAAKRWVDSPEVIATTNLTCKSCHDAGRLEVQMAQHAQREK
jgi:hypothetical protein